MRIKNILLPLAGLLLAACHAESRKAKELLAACDKGDTKACNDVAGRLQRGRYVLRDADRAAQLYDKSCSGNIGDA